MCNTFLTNENFIISFWRKFRIFIIVYNCHFQLTATYEILWDCLERWKDSGCESCFLDFCKFCLIIMFVLRICLIILFFYYVKSSRHVSGQNYIFWILNLLYKIPEIWTSFENNVYFRVKKNSTYLIFYCLMEKPRLLFKASLRGFVCFLQRKIAVLIKFLVYVMELLWFPVLVIQRDHD